MKKRIIDFIITNPLITGLIFIIIGLILLTYQLNRKKPIRFKDSNILSWKGHVYTWAIILMSIIFGLILIFKKL